MSRRCWSPWCFPFGGWLHFLASLANSFPAGLQGSDSSIKIAVFLPNCRKRSNAVFFVPHHLDHLSYEVVLLGRLAGRFCPPRPAAFLCPIWTTDFLQSRFFFGLVVLPSRLSFPFPVFHHFRPSLSSLLSRASFLSALLRSFFVFRRIDRLELAASADG